MPEEYRWSGSSLLEDHVSTMEKSYPLPQRETGFQRSGEIAQTRRRKRENTLARIVRIHVVEYVVRAAGGRGMANVLPPNLPSRVR